MLLFWLKQIIKHLVFIHLFFPIRINSWINPRSALFICQIEAIPAPLSSLRSHCMPGEEKWWPESPYGRRRQARPCARRSVAPGVRGGNAALSRAWPPLSASPLCSLAHPQHTPAPARARRGRAKTCTPCAARACPRQGHAPERARGRHATPALPIWSPRRPATQPCPSTGLRRPSPATIAPAPRPPCAARPL